MAGSVQNAHSSCHWKHVVLLERGIDGAPRLASLSERQHPGQRARQVTRRCPAVADELGIVGMDLQCTAGCRSEPLRAADMVEVGVGNEDATHLVRRAPDVCQRSQ
jgi:hypothetical protein